MNTPFKSRKGVAAEEGTGNHSLSTPVRTAVVPFGTYEVVVKLGQNDKFLGIKEIRITRDFLTLDQTLAHRGSFEIEDLYED